MSADFARTIADAYATEGAALDLGLPFAPAGFPPAVDVEGAARSSPLWAHYGERTDPHSAREMLAARLDGAGAGEDGAPQPAKPDGPELEHVPISESMRAPRRRRSRRRAPAPAGSAPDAIGDFLTSRSGRALQREIVRGVFDLLRTRR